MGEDDRRLVDEPVAAYYRARASERRPEQLGWDALIVSAEPFFSRGTATPRPRPVNDRTKRPTESEE